jgi:hypothetical protein
MFAYNMRKSKPGQGLVRISLDIAETELLKKAEAHNCIISKNRASAESSYAVKQNPLVDLYSLPQSILALFFEYFFAKLLLSGHRVIEVFKSRLFHFSHREK